MTAASVTHADNWRNLAKLRVVLGLVCIAVLVLEYAGQLGLRPTAQPFSQPGEATSYHSLLYDLVAFWLPGGLLVLFAIGLRRVLSPSWLSAGALVLLTLLGLCTVLLGLLPYSPNSLQTRLVRQAARALHLWSPVIAAFLVGGALLTQRLRGQAAFSIGCGVLMAVLAFWITALARPPPTGHHSKSLRHGMSGRLRGCCSGLWWRAGSDGPYWWQRLLS